MLQAVVKNNGDVGKIIPIREIQSLTASAVAEVKNWRFRLQLSTTSQFALG